jgi:hypothetical protein
MRSSWLDMLAMLPQAGGPYRPVAQTPGIGQPSADAMAQGLRGAWHWLTEVEPPWIINPGRSALRSFEGLWDDRLDLAGQLGLQQGWLSPEEVAQTQQRRATLAMGEPLPPPAEVPWWFPPAPLLDWWGRQGLGLGSGSR